MGTALPAEPGVRGGDAHETVIDDRFHFHVEIRHRLVGLIVSYRGWLEFREGADVLVDDVME